MEDRRILEAHDGNLPRNVFQIAEEFRTGFEAVDSIDRPGVSVFGSARVREDSPVYARARTVGQRFAEKGWAVITGGGPGQPGALRLRRRPSASPTGRRHR